MLKFFRARAASSLADSRRQEAARKAAGLRASRQMLLEALAQINTNDWADMIAVSSIAREHELPVADLRRLASHLDQQADRFERETT